MSGWDDEPLGMMVSLSRVSLAYHRENVAVEDPAGAATGLWVPEGDDLRSEDRLESALIWGGAGAHAMGFAGTVAAAAGYDAFFATGGPIDQLSGQRFVSSPQLGYELVIAPSRSVGQLQVVGRRDDMAAILDAGRDATMELLETAVGGAGSAGPGLAVRPSTNSHRAGDDNHIHVSSDRSE